MFYRHRREDNSRVNTDLDLSFFLMEQSHLEAIDFHRYLLNDWDFSTPPRLIYCRDSKGSQISHAFDGSLSQDVRAGALEIKDDSIKREIMRISRNRANGGTHWMAFLDSIHHLAFFIGPTGEFVAGDSSTALARTLHIAVTGWVEGLSTHIISVLISATTLMQRDTTVATEDKAFITDTPFCAVSGAGQRWIETITRLLTASGTEFIMAVRWTCKFWNGKIRKDIDHLFINLVPLFFSNPSSLPDMFWSLGERQRESGSRAGVLQPISVQICRLQFPEFSSMAILLGKFWDLHIWKLASWETLEQTICYNPNISNIK